VIAQAFRHGLTVEEVAQASKYEPWFLRQIAQLVEIEASLRKDGLPKDVKGLLEIKKEGLLRRSPRRADQAQQRRGRQSGAGRWACGRCSSASTPAPAEFESHTPYLLFLLRGRRPPPGRV